MLRGAGGGFCRPWPLTGSCLHPPCFVPHQPHVHLTAAKVASPSACLPALLRPPQLTTSIKIWPFLALRHSALPDPLYPQMTCTATWPCYCWESWGASNDFHDRRASGCYGMQVTTNRHGVTCQTTLNFNPLTPNDHYSGRTAPLTSKRCILYIYSTNIGTECFKHGIYSPFFSSKSSLFHNSNVFGSGYIHILYTECAKIKKK